MAEAFEQPFSDEHEPVVRQSVITAANYEIDRIMANDMFARLEMADGAGERLVATDVTTWRGMNVDRLVKHIPRQLAEDEVLVVDEKYITGLTLLRPFSSEGNAHPSVSGVRLVVVLELEDGSEATTVIGGEDHYTAEPDSIDITAKDLGDTNTYLGRIRTAIEVGVPVGYLPFPENEDQAAA